MHRHNTSLRSTPAIAVLVAVLVAVLMAVLMAVLEKFCPKY